MYKQPKPPALQPGQKITEYLHLLGLYLRDFCQSTWQEDKQTEDRLEGLTDTIGQ